MAMKKTLPLILIVLSVLIVSCEFGSYDYNIQYVSNEGTVTSSTDSGRTTITVDFPASASVQVYDQHNKKVEMTIDDGRYNTLIKVFSDNALADEKLYRCHVTDQDVTSIKKVGESFILYSNEKKYASIEKGMYFTELNSAFTMTITYGGELILDYSNLPISPVGLPSGTLWNDNGTLRIVP